MKRKESLKIEAVSTKKITLKTGTSVTKTHKKIDRKEESVMPAEENVNCHRMTSISLTNTMNTCCN